MFDGQEQKHKSAANFSIILFFVFRLCDDFPNLKDKGDLVFLTGLLSCPGSNGDDSEKIFNFSLFSLDNLVLLIDAPYISACLHPM